MASNINFDSDLLEAALKLGGFKYKKDAVNAALKEYVSHHQQMKLLELFGQIDYDDKYDYKKERNK